MFSEASVILFTGGGLPTPLPPLDRDLLLDRDPLDRDPPPELTSSGGHCSSSRILLEVILVSDFNHTNIVKKIRV